MTALDLQMKSLRDATVDSIRQMASRMREEATDVKATVGDIEDWLDRIKQLAEEVRKKTISWLHAAQMFATRECRQLLLAKICYVAQKK